MSMYRSVPLDPRVRWPHLPVVPATDPSGSHARYLAHAFGARYELPLPLILFVLGGALVVGVSFLIVAPRAVAAGPSTGLVDRVPVGSTHRVAGPLGLVVLVGLTYAGVTGSQEVPENIVPTWFWLITWIAVPLSCGILGDWTRPVNPFRTLARWADSGRLRRMVLGTPDRLPWPTALGWWPAVATYFALACGELVYNQTATLPRVTAYVLLIGAVLALLMGLLVGADAWLNRGEMFSVLFATWGRLGVRRFGAPGRPGYAGGLDAPFDPAPSRVVFVLLLLVSVSFDGLLSTPTWKTVRSHFTRWTDGSAVGTDSLTTASFVGLTALMLALFGVFAMAVAGIGGHRAGFFGSLAALLPSMAPIAFGYLLAHNLEYLVVNGQLLIPLIGNPTGTAHGQWAPAPFNDDYEIRTHLLSSAFYWYVAVVAIVIVHVVAVVIAHRHLTRAGRTPDRARRSEYPWIIAMIGYTMLSLWLLAQPLTEEHPTTSQSLGAAPSLGRAR